MYSPNAVRFFVGQFGGDLFVGQMATAIVVAQFLLQFDSLFAQKVEPSLGAETTIGATIVQQRLHLAVVQIQTFALQIWTVIAAV